jgi:hypothetical protein
LFQAVNHLTLWEAKCIRSTCCLLAPAHRDG